MIYTEEADRFRYNMNMTRKNTLGRYICFCLCLLLLMSCQPVTHSHTWDEGTILKEATCSEPGEIVYKCTECSATREQVIPAGHNWRLVESESISATCITAGMATYQCERCNERKTEGIRAKGHQWIEQEKIIPATCRKNGESKCICSVCEAIEIVEIPAIGGTHAFVDYHCTKCGLAGGVGPAKGYFFYDKGYYSDGWRYLEAAPADLRIIDGNPTVDPSQSGYSSALGDGLSLFAVGRYEINGNSVFVNGTATHDESCTSTNLGTGLSNTNKLFDVLKNQENIEAVKLCKNLSHSGFSDWFIPSFNELKAMYENLYLEGIGNFANSDSYGDYLSSSECVENASEVYGLRFTQYWEFESLRGSFDESHGLQVVRPIRAF